jgi:hypothetical protein
MPFFHILLNLHFLKVVGRYYLPRQQSYYCYYIFTSFIPSFITTSKNLTTTIVISCQNIKSNLTHKLNLTFTIDINIGFDKSIKTSQLIGGRYSSFWHLTVFWIHISMEYYIECVFLSLKTGNARCFRLLNLRVSQPIHGIPECFWVDSWMIKFIESRFKNTSFLTWFADYTIVREVSSWLLSNAWQLYVQVGRISISEFNVN